VIRDYQHHQERPQVFERDVVLGDAAPTSRFRLAVAPLLRRSRCSKRTRRHASAMSEVTIHASVRAPNTSPGISDKKLYCDMRVASEVSGRCSKL